MIYKLAYPDNGHFLFALAESVEPRLLGKSLRWELTKTGGDPFTFIGIIHEATSEEIALHEELTKHVGGE